MDLDLPRQDAGKGAGAETGPPPSQSANKVFLLTSSRPDQDGIGAMFLRDVLRGAPDMDISWHVLPTFLLSYLSGRKGIFWRALNSLLSRFGLLQALRLGLFVRWQLKSAADRIERDLLAEGSPPLWVTTANSEIICVAAELARRGHDLRVTVWDAPEYLIQNLRLPAWSANRILGCFSDLLQHARGCSVVSDAMREDYASRFANLPLGLMRHGIAPLPPDADAPATGPVRVIYAGSLYAKHEWNSFVQALEGVKWRIAGRPIQLEFVGTFPLNGAHQPKGMIYHPPMSQKDVMAHMALADIGYLPYWLDPAKRFVARTSFPGKMTAYSAAGLAVFHHGPENSSVSNFLGQFPYGVACNTPHAEDILRALEELVLKMNDADVQQARDAAMEQELSDAAMIRGFRALVAPGGDRP